MEESKMIDFGQVEDTSKHIIKVIGVGGGGCNAVRSMFDEGIKDVTFAVCNTDSKTLSGSPVPVKVLLGDKGLGAGNIPEVGREEAEKSRDMIEHLFDDNTQMVFITAGMGGGTGTGSAPVVAKIAKEKGLLTVGVVTIPFNFEKRKKIIQALQGVEEMRKNVDALLIINNERICDIYADAQIPVKEAFRSADQVLCNAVKSISEMITVEGQINLDFCDVRTTMGAKGGAIMAIGRAKGENRVRKAFLNALESPLLYGSDIDKAKRILFNIYTSPEHTILVNEMRQIDDFMDELNPDIEVIWGLSEEEGLGEDAKVAILATGLEDELCRPKDENALNDVDYDEIITKLYRPTPTNKEPVTNEIPIEIVVPDGPEAVETPTPDSAKGADSEPERHEPEPKNPDSEPRRPSLLERLRQRFVTFTETVISEEE